MYPIVAAIGSSRKIDDPGRQSRREYELENQISVILTSNINGLPGGRAMAALDRAGLMQGELDAAGKLCGMIFTAYPGQPGSKPGDPLNPVTQSRAYTATTPPGTGATGAICTSGSPICTITFDYRGFNGSFPISHERFCEWPSRARQIVQFLDRHLIRETQRASRN